MAILPLTSCKRNSVLLFIFCGQRTLPKCHSLWDMCSIWWQVFTRPTIHVWCKKFACGRESVVEKKRPGWCVVLTTDAVIAAVTYHMVW